MLPNKLQHGDTLASLLQKYNEMVDYLRETRLVAGPGMRINRHPAGTTIESTATATGGAPAAPAAQDGHPFDVELINNGTEENPDYSVRVFNSALPDSPYAGTVKIGNYNISVPVDEISVTLSDYFNLDIVITYNSTKSPPFDISFQVRLARLTPQDGPTTYRKSIAQGKLPDISSWQNTDIEVLERWI